jgi:hypothetical protein
MFLEFARFFAKNRPPLFRSALYADKVSKETGMRVESSKPPTTMTQASGMPSTPMSAASMSKEKPSRAEDRRIEFYAPAHDYIQLPSPQSYFEPINWHRTALHELGHWTGHASRLARDLSGAFGSKLYSGEELVAEMTSAFCCATLGIIPTVRHADYIGAWLEAPCQFFHLV